MHYESDDDTFVFLANLTKNFDVLGEIKDSQSFKLPQANVNHNQVYERGRKL